MRQGKAVWGILLALVLSGCASTTLQTYQPKTPDETLVVATLLKVQNGINSKSVELVMQAYADDVYVGNFHKYLGVAARNAPLQRNKADLQATYRQVFKDVKAISMAMRNFQLVVSGDRAVATARTELTYKVEAGRGEKRDEVLLNDVQWQLQRTPAGWRIKEEIYQ